MKVITQCGFLFFVCLVGVHCSHLLPFPVPASVLSMLVLFVLLLSRGIDPSSLKETTDVLLGNMAFFFIPSGVGILAHLETLRDDALALLAVCCAATFLTFAASVAAVTAAARLQQKICGKSMKGVEPQ
ncbi:MAG: CidA/LrgA family protein [Synergistaceae bacterium]|jgi:holin-like protein|nr:CidA/LrgA family protein [Synergistaceae bacterium]